MCVCGGGDPKEVCVAAALNDMDAEVNLMTSRISY